jgi:hypothetical protein
MKRHVNSRFHLPSAHGSSGGTPVVTLVEATHQRSEAAQAALDAAFARAQKAVAAAAAAPKAQVCTQS